ncbi:MULTISPECIES: SDR family oxidoreductase [Pseudomonas]|uniref:SDR family oxidoreductase n=1 Tax=Pseudomonas TaxID=286 RepID=UPI001AE176AB|nr:MULTISPECIES: SDR family oxidoreductase [Pseudomonas]MBP2272927.1 NAD(P)-dependent dehydrogenase (short-subunit alcohol dehydrogenase family) [Pseudomonas sp. BP6]MBP2288101.1 NAD(P)-dependent dehydrogenase (short-subunit alcohol dehydrogenase family) [Pseudomonas sp. BP7]WRW01785.1 SDR family oxidoreductase [Pseudomonas putida]HDS1696176.1 SDR family oxidoreductase [Pseudomonas putida]HDS1701273.1 SDR family oxidoreductase [Pseudomonas putida]
MSKQRVLITAGASGIGYAIALAFNSRGADVTVVDIDSEGLNRLQLEQPSIRTAVCDVAERDSLEHAIPGLIEAMGGLDVLVNNAGVSGPTAPVDQLDPDEWDNVMRINLNGTFNVTRLAIPALKRSSHPSIIHMSSVAGRLGYPDRSPYSTSKWGLIGFTKSLSRELGVFGIRVNAILPGAVEGERFENVLKGRANLSGNSVEEERTKAFSVQSLQRLVDPKDIAELAVFLASDAGKSISGQLLPIDNDMQQTM